MSPHTRSAADLQHNVQQVRRFNRFYTRTIGVLNEGLLASPFSLTEVRVLFEIAHHERTAASEIAERLGLDPGYLSRILRGFERRGLVERVASESDRRRNLLRLSVAGRKTFSALDAGASEEVEKMLRGLSAAERLRLVEAMHVIEETLGGSGEAGEKATADEAPPPAYVLRPPRPGDMGWVVHRHGALYAREHGWDERFEALVARVVADFTGGHDPARERCWIAEGDRGIVGSVFLVSASPAVARLRLLLVEPEARGLGLGTRLVDECVRFARGARYRKVTLWTQSVLHAARRLYESAGFRLVREEPHRSFGAELVGETWELDLSRARSSAAAPGRLEKKPEEDGRRKRRAGRPVAARRRRG